MIGVVEEFVEKKLVLKIYLEDLYEFVELTGLVIA